MPHAVTAVAPGLQALILCGPGSSFPTFTANPDENPKALLPIANRPMVWYALSFCYRMGISDITLICPPTSAEAMNTSLKTNPFLTSLPLPSPWLLAPKDLTYNTGTAEILRLPEVRQAVTKDFIVLPCDLVCELGGDKLVQAWMVQAASLSDLSNCDDPAAAAATTAGLSSTPTASSFDQLRQTKRRGKRSGGLGVWYDTMATPIKGEETDFYITTSVPTPTVAPPKDSILPNLRKVVYSMPMDSLNDVVEERKGLPVRHSLLSKHPRTLSNVNHRDAHIYVFPRWVMDFVAENDRFDSIAEDVVGWWAKAGWQDGLVSKLGLDKVLGSGSAEGKSSPSDAGDWSPENSDDESEPQSPTTDRPTSQDGAKPSITTTGSQRKPCATVPPFLAYVHPSQPTDPIIRRVDTAQALLEVSLQLAKLPSLEELSVNHGAAAAAAAASPFAHARKVAYPEGVKSRTTITRADSLVADNVIVEEKVAIKESVVGANCKIMEGAKLQHCLLMDGVVVGKNCKLVRCVLGKRAEIGEGSTLMDCEVQENLLVEPQTEEKNTKIMSSSGLEATEEEMQDVLGTSDDDELDTAA